MTSDTASRIAATREAAINFLDDYEHIREITEKLAVTTGDLRRLSNILRRLLIAESGDLPKVFGPRFGKPLHLLAPDTKKLSSGISARTTYFASLGASKLFGGKMESFVVDLTWRQWPYGGDERITMEGSRGTPDGSTVTVKIDGFLKQTVLFFAGKWFSRKDVLTYVANIAGGVHSGFPTDKKYQDLHRVRQLASFFLKDGEMALRFNSSVIKRPTTLDEVNAFGIDFVHLQILSMARYIVLSSDVTRLKESIEAERDKILQR